MSSQLIACRFLLPWDTGSVFLTCPFHMNRPVPVLVYWKYKLRLKSSLVWVVIMMCVLTFQPSLLGHDRQLLEHVVDSESVDDVDDADNELMWRAPSSLSLADIPWLVDDTVEPGVTLRYIASHN